MQHRSERFLAFYLDHYLCAFHVDMIREINETHSQWHSSSRDIEIRGESLKIYDLKMKLGLDKTIVTETSRLVILKSQKVPRATVVDAVHAVIDLYSDQWEALSESDLAPFADTKAFRAIATWRGRTVLLLDPSVLFEQDRERTIA